MPRKFLTPDATHSTGNVWRSFFIPEGLLHFVSGASQELCHAYNWEVFGDMGAEEIAQVFTDLLSEPMDNPLLGTIQSYISDNPPVGMLPLDGSTHSRLDYPKLYDVLPVSMRTGIIEFTLPDARGRFLRVDNGDFLVPGGADTHTLTESEMPPHSHTYTPPVANLDLEAPGAPDILAAGVGVVTSTGDAGKGSAHNNVPKFLPVKYGVVHD